MSQLIKNANSNGSSKTLQSRQGHRNGIPKLSYDRRVQESAFRPSYILSGIKIIGHYSCGIVVQLWRQNTYEIKLNLLQMCIAYRRRRTTQLLCTNCTELFLYIYCRSLDLNS